MTKRIPPKTFDDPSPPRGSIITIGSGMTEQTYPVFVFGLSKQKYAPKGLEQPRNASSVVGYGGYGREVARARRTLERVGLPTDPCAMHSFPDKRGKCTMLELVERSGYKEEDAEEWYAAKILQCSHEATSAWASIEQK